MVDQRYKRVRMMPGRIDPSRVIKPTQSQYNSQASFQIFQSDKDLIVLSNKYIDELHSLPKSIYSVSQAMSDVCIECVLLMFSVDRRVQLALGKYSTIDTLIKSDLHLRVLQTRLTPNLKGLILIKDELEIAIAEKVLASDGNVLSLIDIKMLAADLSILYCNVARLQ